MKPTPRMRAAMQELSQALLDAMLEQAPHFQDDMEGRYRVPLDDAPDNFWLMFRIPVIVDGRVATDDEFDRMAKV